MITKDPKPLEGVYGHLLLIALSAKQMGSTFPTYFPDTTPSLILLANFSRLLDLLVNEAIAGGDMRDGDMLDDVTGPLTTAAPAPLAENCCCCCVDCGN